MVAGLVTVNVNVVLPPKAIDVGLKTLVRVGTASVTVKHWLVTPFLMADKPEIAVVLLVNESLPVVKVLVPQLARSATGVTWLGLLVTLTEIVQVTGVAPAARIPAPETPSVSVPAVAVTVPDGVQVLSTAGAAATIKLFGKLSVKPKPVIAGLPAGLVIVNVNVDTPPEMMLFGENALVNVGGG